MYEPLASFRPIAIPIAQSISRALNETIGSAYNPLSLFAKGEQGVWYDPSDLSTLFQDVAGTIPVTGAGQPVGLMRDKSGRGNHATQEIATSRPILKTANGLWWLAFDGVDDGLVTGNINFTATDKMTGWVGVTKTNDAIFRCIMELTSDTNSTNGGFLMATSITTGDISRRTYGCLTRGTTSALTGSASIYPAPNTKVMSVSADNAAVSSTLSIAMRLNAVDQSLTYGSSTVAGNYANAPIYIGRRAGTTSPLIGNIYGLIVRGTASDAATIAQTEAWMNSKTGAY